MDASKELKHKDEMSRGDAFFFSTEEAIDQVASIASKKKDWIPASYFYVQRLERDLEMAALDLTFQTSCKIRGIMWTTIMR